MYEMFLYFVCAYFVVGLVLVGGIAVARRNNGSARLRSRKEFLPACALILLAPLVPYAQVGAQTLAFGPVLRPVVQKSLVRAAAESGNAPITVLRVVSITLQKAQVYVVQTPQGKPSNLGNGRAGLIFDLVRTPKGWHYKKHHSLWMDGGNAEGNTFPPYPEGL